MQRTLFRPLSRFLYFQFRQSKRPLQHPSPEFTESILKYSIFLSQFRYFSHAGPTPFSMDPTAVFKHGVELTLQLQLTNVAISEPRSGTGSPKFRGCGPSLPSQ